LIEGDMGRRTRKWLGRQGELRDGREQSREQPCAFDDESNYETPLENEQGEARRGEANPKGRARRRKGHACAMRFHAMTAVDLCRPGTSV
jgi:hypothetical protein